MTAGAGCAASRRRLQKNGHSLAARLSISEVGLETAIRPRRPNSLLEYPLRAPRRAPDQPLPLPSRDVDRYEWIVAAPLHARERWAYERERQHCGEDHGRCA